MSTAIEKGSSGLEVGTTQAGSGVYSSVARVVMFVAILVGFAWAGTASIRNFAVALLSLSILVMAAAKFYETGHRRRIAAYWQKALKTWDGRFPSDRTDELKAVLASAPSLTLPTMLFYSVLVDRVKEAPLSTLTGSDLKNGLSPEMLVSDLEDRVETAINRMVAELPIASLNFKNEITGHTYQCFGVTVAEAWARAALSLIGDFMITAEGRKVGLRFKSGAAGSANTVEKGCELVLKAAGWVVT